MFDSITKKYRAKLAVRNKVWVVILGRMEFDANYYRDIRPTFGPADPESDNFDNELIELVVKAEEKIALMFSANKQIKRLNKG